MLVGWFKRTASAPAEVRESDPAGKSAPVPPARDAAAPVNLQTALSLSGVYRAIQILSTTAGQLELSAYRRGVELAPAPALVERPDVDRPRRPFIKRTVVGLAGTGNAFWRVFRSPDGRPSTMRVLDPLTMYVGRDRFGRRYFDYHDPWTAKSERLSPVRDRGRSGDVLHLRLLEVPGMELGLGPIQACRLSIGGALDLTRYADDWFGGSGIPSGVLSTTTQLNADDADRYRDRWNKSIGEHGLAVLGSGLKYAPIMLKPADAQFLESRQFSITDQARMFGIPATYLLAEVNGSAMTYQNMEQADIALMKYAAMDYLNVIEDALSELLPNGQTARFKLFGGLRSDNLTRAQINQIYLQAGVKSPEQVAREEGLPEPPALPAHSERTPANG